MTLPEPVQPEDLVPAQLSLVPNPPQERTATALVALLIGVSEVMHIPADQLVQVQGAVHDNGHIGLFEHLTWPGTREIEGYLVGWRAADSDGHTAIWCDTREKADEVYSIAWEKITNG